jgi:hypothetical protein
MFWKSKQFFMILSFWVLAPVNVNILERHTVCTFSPEDGDSLFLRNAGIYRRVYTAPKPRRTVLSSSSLLLKHQITEFFLSSRVTELSACTGLKTVYLVFLLFFGL